MNPKKPDKPVVLVVDDTPENIELLVNILREDYRVKVAINGEQALKIIRAAPPDLILLDVMMPGIDGFEVCRRLKADFTTRSIPVIFITAMISVEDELKGLELGANDYITKPISPPIVMARVRTHLALYNQNRELDRKIFEKTRELQQTRLEVVRRLGRAAEYKDNETGLHVIRMSLFARMLALKAGMSEADADTLMHAAPMHDIGKIGIPDSILQKPGKLDPDEWEIMKTHAVIGAEIIGDDASALMQMARQVAISHHERWDGTGYPHGLAGEHIPRIGRIVAIADVFDALTSERPYKRAWSIEAAFEHLEKGAGAHFDPVLVPLFLEMRDEIDEIRAKYAEVPDEAPE